MSSICKYYTQAQLKKQNNTDKKGSTCDFSILSKANGINITEQQPSYCLGHCHAV